MGNFINSTTLIPLIPLITSLFIFILLASFNRTLNRLTKPVTAMVVLSLLSSAFISLFDYFKKIEEELVLKNKMLAISEIIIASAIFLGIVYWEVKFLYAKTNVAK